MNQKRLPISRLGAFLACGLTCFGLLPAFGQENDEDDVYELSPFTVSEDGQRGYRASNTISGTRINTALRNVPLSLEVITEDFIDDIAAFDLQDSLRYTTGVTTSGDTGGRIRGFPMLWNQRNGFRRYDFGDAANIQRVEVIKGPAGVLYGLTRPGGIVNYITKRPVVGGSFSEVRLTYGSEDFKRAEFDTNVAMDDTLAFRLIASRTENESAIINKDREITFLSPSILYRPTDKTTIILEAEVMERDQVRTVGRLRSISNTFDNGDPLYVDELFPFISINERFAHPDEIQRNEATTFFLTVEHEFSDNFQLRFNTYLIDRTDREISTARRGFMTNILPTTDSDGNTIVDAEGNPVPHIGRHWADDRSLNDFKSYQLDLLYTFETENIEHRFVGGWTWREDINDRLLFEDRDFLVIEDPANPGTAPDGFRSTPVGGGESGRPLGWLGSARKRHFSPLTDLSDLSINNPFNDQPTFQFPWLEYKDDIDAEAYYLNYFATAFDDQLVVMAGLRYQESSKTRASVGAVGAEAPWEDDYLAPQVGVIYNWREELGLYAVYAESFDPQNGRSNSFLEQFDPLVGENLEFGLKGDIDGGRYAYTFSYFDVDETNRIFFDPDIPNAGGTLGDDVAAGLVNSKGIDLTFTANPTPNWSTILGISYIDSEQVEPTRNKLDNFEGTGLTWSLWTNYTFVEGAIEGLSIGGGVTYTDEWDGFGGRVFGDYHLVDARVAYAFRLTDEAQASISLNVKNLTDKETKGGGSWLDPRAFFLTGAIDF